jgi:hypothetical protein
MTKNEEHCVFLATDDELSGTHYYLRVWLAARNLPIGRRRWLDEIADTFRDYRGIIWAPDGKVYEVPLVDDIFGDDADMRWMSDYLRPDMTGNAPHQFTLRLDRVRLIDLYFKIRCPEIARHFKR